MIKLTSPNSARSMRLTRISMKVFMICNLINIISYSCLGAKVRNDVIIMPFTKPFMLPRRELKAAGGQDFRIVTCRVAYETPTGFGISICV